MRVFVTLAVVTVCVPGSTNVGEQLPTGQLSVVPWRRTGVKYTNNEAYFDVVEEIDAIIDKSGIIGSIQPLCRAVLAEIE